MAPKPAQVNENEKNVVIGKKGRKGRDGEERKRKKRRIRKNSVFSQQS